MQKYKAQTIGKNSRKDFELNNISTLVDTDGFYIFDMDRLHMLSSIPRKHYPIPTIKHKKSDIIYVTFFALPIINTPPR